MNLIDIDGRRWSTPLTAVELRTVGTARLRQSHYRGMYHANGVNGYEYWQTRYWLPVTSLQLKEGRRWNTWMVDDPVHWWGMREAVADLPAGRILVAGLGLGLMLHHMARQPRFTTITVVEQNPDVITLIRPTLPENDRVQIYDGDFYRWIERASANGVTYDGILWDLAVGDPEDTRGDLLRGMALCALHLPGVPLRQFGIRKTPAPDPRELLRSLSV